MGCQGDPNPHPSLGGPCARPAPFLLYYRSSCRVLALKNIYFKGFISFSWITPSRDHSWCCSGTICGTGYGSGGRRGSASSYLVQVLWIHKDAVSCDVGMDIFILVQEFQGVQLWGEKPCLWDRGWLQSDGGLS